MSELTDEYFVALNNAIETNSRGEKIWLSCLLYQPAPEVKKRMTDYLSTMCIIYSLFCAFSVSDIGNPITTTSNGMINYFLVMAALEAYTMLSLLSASSVIYLYILLLPNDINSVVIFIQKFNRWISWYSLYGMFFAIICQINNVNMRLYNINYTSGVTLSIIGATFVSSVFVSMLCISFHTHKTFEEEYKKYPQIVGEHHSSSPNVQIPQ
jgi:hypothetical protein